MMWAYRISYAISFCLAQAVGLVVPKVRRAIVGRRGLTARAAQACAHWPAGCARYWVHCASSGEFEQALGVIEEIKKQNPHSRVFLTYFSPSAERAVTLEKMRRAQRASELPWDAADYSPLDFPNCVRAFIRTIQPSVLAVMNREFWPELFQACVQNAVPIVVLAVYLPKGGAFLRWYRPWLNRVTHIAATDAVTASAIRATLSVPVSVMGDPRIQRIVQRRDWQMDRIEQEWTRPERVFLAASLWPEDLKALRPALDRLFSARPAWAVLLVPHEPHPSFVAQLEEVCLQAGVAVSRWSENATVPDTGAVIVDTVGGLAELYRFASLAFVGGSFKARVHNVLEPAAYGTAILTGPCIQNSLEAVQMAAREEGVRRAKDAQTLEYAVALALDNPDWVRTQGAKALYYVETRLGAGAEMAELVRKAALPVRPDQQADVVVSRPDVSGQTSGLVEYADA